MVGAGVRRRLTRSFLVTWQIDIDAADPVEAAQRALEIQRDEESIATVFVVHQGVLDAWQVDPTVNVWDARRGGVV